MTVRQAINERYSTRNLDSSKKISEKDLDLILEAGIFAPNGLGLEAWKFIAVDGNKEKLTEAAYGQKHVGDSSHVVALLSYKDKYLRENPTVLETRFNQMNITKDKQKFYETKLFGMNNITDYIIPQVHIAAGYMSLQAKELNIGSVIVGGFDPEAVAKVLNIDNEKFEVTLLLSLGYNKDTEAKARQHREKKELIEKITLN